MRGIPCTVMAKRSGYSLRQLKSGRWQVLLRDPGTGKFFGAGSYANPKEAERAGQRSAAEQSGGTWLDPRRGEIPLAVYMADWLEARRRTGRHGDRYAAEAARMARLHIVPALGQRLLIDLRPPVIRAWYEDLVARRLKEAGTVGLVPAKSYRLLSAVLNTAARDELIRSNPCTIPGAGVEHSEERPLVELDQIRRLIDALPERWQAMGLTAAWCGLRFGELVGLQRKHIDLLHGTISVESPIAELPDGRLVKKAPKTKAGRRPVAIPGPLIPMLETHLAAYGEPGPEGYVFLGPKGGMPRRSNWSTMWRKACADAGLDGIRLHDLRHASGTMWAQLGATAREIQSRLGHSSPAAAHRYQHAADRRDRELAERLGELMGGVALAHPSRTQPQPRPEMGV